MTPAERAALPEVEWDAFTAPSHKHLRSVNTLGTWHIGHPMENGGGHEPVELSYQTAVAPGEDPSGFSDKLKTLDDSDPEWWRLMATRHRQEFGRVYNQDYAKVFVERARRAAPGQDPEAILKEAGFAFVHEIKEGRDSATKVFRKHDDDSFFSVFISPNSFWLMHEKNGAGHHTNLLSFHTTERASNGDLIPRFFSPEVAEPIAACADMATYFTEHWTPAPKVAKAPKRTP